MTTSSPADHRPNPTTPSAQQGAVLRVLARVEVDPETGCWVSTGSLTGKGGYGRVMLSGRKVRCHRLMLADATGRDLATVDRAEHACHTCDRPLCCNPAHLWWGTRAANMQDAVAKGRHRSHNTAKTHCPRGHRLGGPNNAPSRERVGQRQCLLCKRAHSWLSVHGLDPHDDVFLDVSTARELLRTDAGRDRLAAYVLAS